MSSVLTFSLPGPRVRRNSRLPEKTPKSVSVALCRHESPHCTTGSVDVQGYSPSIPALSQLPLVPRPRDFASQRRTCYNAADFLQNSGQTLLVQFLRESHRLRIIGIVVPQSSYDSVDDVLARQPMAAGQLLLALDDYLHPQPEIVLLGSGSDYDDVLTDLRGRYLPGLVIASRPTANAGTNISDTLSPILAGKHIDGDGPTAYICRDFACQTPDIGKEAILASWENA